MRRLALALLFIALLALGLAMGFRRGKSGEEALAAVDAPRSPGPWSESPFESAKVSAMAPAEKESRRQLVAGSSGGCGGADGGPTLKALLRRQGADGAWGELPEEFEGRLYTRNGATSLALLAFVGAGYTALSRDLGDGVTIGGSLKRGLEWLNSHPPATAFDAALMALALTEYAGVSGAESAAQSALEALIRLDAFQRADGSWGDPFTDFCGALALVSARAGSIGIPPSMFDRASAGLQARLSLAPDLPAVSASVFLDRERNPPGYEAIEAELLANLPDSEHPEFTRDWMASLLLFQACGPSGEPWKTWNEPLKNALIPTRQRDGTWPGGYGPTASVVRDAFGALVLEVYYRYRNVPGVRDGGGEVGQGGRVEGR
ncbi:MAG: hypothetical protein HYY18_07855 [Planctomycetes bacterium]|nr:hypothetical protein [Planctomycetota bacterium]